MKKVSRFLLFVLTIGTLLLSACGAAAATAIAPAGGGKVEPILVAFIGILDSIAGDQWVINGQTVTVAPEVIRDGTFNIGDQLKVEGVVNSDGSFTVATLEVSTPQDASSLPQFGDDNSNEANGNDANTNDDNGNDVNSNDDNGNDANSNDDNGNESNSNDDNGNDANSNDDNGNDSNSNDDNGGNDNSDDVNSNDDNSGGGNDNGGGGGNDDNGSGDDNEDNSND
jgi:hypothetical protein